MRSELPEEKKQAVEERLLKEAATLEEFWSPYFPKVYDIRRRSDDNSLYIIGQYFPGSTLAEILEVKNKNILTKEFYLNLKEDLHFALSYLHQRKGVLHLDLSPDNIIIDLDHRAHIIDFDNSKKIGETLSFQEVRGKPRYLSPDLKNNEMTRLGIRHDDYAKQVILKEVRDTLTLSERIRFIFPSLKKLSVGIALTALILLLAVLPKMSLQKRSPAIPKEDEVTLTQSAIETKTEKTVQTRSLPKAVKPKKKIKPPKKKVTKAKVKANPKPTFKSEFQKLITTKNQDFKNCLSLSPKRKKPILINFEIEPLSGYLKKVDIKEATNLSETTQICLETIYRELHFPSSKAKRNIIITQKFWIPSR